MSGWPGGSSSSVQWGLSLGFSSSSPPSQNVFTGLSLYTLALSCWNRFRSLNPTGIKETVMLQHTRTIVRFQFRRRSLRNNHMSVRWLRSGVHILLAINCSDPDGRPHFAGFTKIKVQDLQVVQEYCKWGGKKQKHTQQQQSSAFKRGNFSLPQYITVENSRLTRYNFLTA